MGGREANAKSTYLDVSFVKGEGSSGRSFLLFYFVLPVYTMKLCVNRSHIKFMEGRTNDR